MIPTNIGRLFNFVFKGIAILSVAENQSVDQMPGNIADFGRVAVTAGVAKSSRLEHPLDIADYATVYGGTAIGKYTYINVGTVVYSNASIGRFCSIGRQVEIGTAKHPVDFLSTHPFQYASSLFMRDPVYA